MLVVRYDQYKLEVIFLREVVKFFKGNCLMVGFYNCQRCLNYRGDGQLFFIRNGFGKFKCFDYFFSKNELEIYGEIEKYIIRKII